MVKLPLENEVGPHFGISQSIGNYAKYAVNMSKSVHFIVKNATHFL